MHEWSPQVAGRVAVVTGAQQGIGREAALALASSGCKVAATWLDDENAGADLTRLVESRGGHCVAVHADLADMSSIGRIFEQAEEKFGTVDILVNNAGIFPRASLLELDEETWERTVAINLKAAAFCTQRFARGLRKADRPGSVINISSMALRGSPLGSHYSASKGGLVSFTRAAALELAALGIRVNAIAPGIIDTNQPRGAYSEVQLEAYGRSLPLGRLGQPADIASVVLFLASEASSFITGEVINVNGGAYMA